LERLLNSLDLDRQPAATLSFLAGALRDHGRSELVLRRAQWKYPGDYWINHRLGINVVFASSPEVIQEGIGYMRAALAVRPNDAHCIMNLGVGYKRLGQFDQAIACYRKAIELKPKYSSAYSNLGSVLSLKGMHEEAIACHRKAIELSPDDRPYNNLGIALGRRGLYAEAISAFERAVTCDSDAASEAHAELSMIYSNCPDARFRNADRALELAAKAVKLGPVYSTASTALGLARYRLGQWHEAALAFEKALQLGADNTMGSGRRWGDAVNQFSLAMAHWQMGEQDEARRRYSRAVGLMEKDKKALDQSPQQKEELVRFRAEAAELLKIPPPAPATNPAPK
jgi:tetratricopeptide (TPR) repeat protein